MDNCRLTIGTVRAFPVNVEMGAFSGLVATLLALTNVVLVPWLLSIGEYSAKEYSHTVHQLIIKRIGLRAEHHSGKPAYDNDSQKNTKHTVASQYCAISR